MTKCIYCRKNKKDTDFNKEHVLPKSMGRFDNNLTLKNIVCSDCNSKVFSPLETLFKEDTEEGLYYQMFNLQNSEQIRVKNKNTKINFNFNINKKFFNNTFPIFSLQKDNTWKPSFIPQIRIDNYSQNGYIILLIDKVKILPKGKFNRLKKFLTRFSPKDMSIYVSDIGKENPFAEAVNLLKTLDINYKHKTTVYSDTNPTTIEFNTTGIINEIAGRILAKIAFNYFAYCAVKDNKISLLFHSNFNETRSYVLGTRQLPTKSIITNITNEPITVDEQIENVQNKQIPAHTIVLEHINDKLIARISFLGLKTYTIELGNLPDKIKLENFGSGHMFDPINKNIFPLTQNIQNWKSDLPYTIGLNNAL